MSEITVGDKFKIKSRKGLCPFQTLLIYEVEKVDEKHIYFFCETEDTDVFGKKYLHKSHYKYTVKKFNKYLVRI